jgi:hypothetical protein
MKNQVALPVKTKYYTFKELVEGVNELFSYVYNARTRQYDTRKMFIYIHNGKFVMNTFTPRIDSCSVRFKTILDAKGDYSKVNFECKYPLDIL